MRLAIKLIEALLVALLLAMVLMVFGNVVLRYAFNSGISVSEELSRFCFVWLTFIGAVLAAYEGAHLGVDMLVARLPRRGRIVCLLVCEGLTLMVCAMLFWGTWRQHEINATNAAPITGIPMSWIFGLGYFTALGIAAIALVKLWRLVSGRLSDAELIDVRENEELLT
ncbi:TRAP transporter small permease [Aquabacterium sp.]|uniref:TRAP transporter small permease n=1 Tax=Aquabacterium sp. TaxID=1872578 RepID=UPI002BCFB911|nr:TRAP transporter small permease [Aquabacterium sp.]HSW06965.1 TRAP transporter small permease [Aquabacterium sp.]